MNVQSTHHPLTAARSSPLKGERDKLIKLAKLLKKQATPHERKLWGDSKSIQNSRFRRQVVIGRYIVDFAYHKNKLIIELDGIIDAVNVAVKPRSSLRGELPGRAEGVTPIAPNDS